MMNKKICYISIDFEEWYHVPFMKSYYDKNKSFSYCDSIPDFVKELNNENIKITIFVVADLAEKYKTFLTEAHSSGNVIGCHSLNHSDFNNLTLEEFSCETKTAKEQMENVLGFEVTGFRAPMFSASIEKINELKKIGFKFDSSAINSRSNPLYKQISEKELKNLQINEYPIPTLNRIPIGGGGYFRGMPFWHYKILLKKYIKKHDEFVFFIHPYEIDKKPFPGFKHGLFSKGYFAFNLKRKITLWKFNKLIKFLKKEEFEFRTMGE